MPRFPKTVEVTAFVGLNNVLPPERTPNQFLKTAENVDIDKSGGVHKRPGYSLKIAGNFHSIWGEGYNFFAVKDGYLVRIKDDYTVENLIEYPYKDRISYSSIEGSYDVYFTSPKMCGIIEGNTVKPLGYEAPNPPTVTEVTSNTRLTAGLYQVSLTYVDGNNLESGAKLGQKVSIQDGSSIVLTDIKPSTDSEIQSIRIYCSTPNGETQYLLGQVPVNTTTYTITSVHSEGVTPLKSFNMFPAPKGDIIRYFKGRLWIAQGNVLWYSSPFSLGWFSLAHDFFQFEHEITELMPVEEGIWIGTEKGLNYLSGKEPEKMNLSLKEPVSVVRNTGERVAGIYNGEETPVPGYQWLVTTDKGVFVCFNNGVAVNKTETNVAFPKADKGVSTFIKKDGINRYLTLLQEKEPSNNTAATDIVTATVIRNGVVV
jgi:hypothetical protein